MNVSPLCRICCGKGALLLEGNYPIYLDGRIVGQAAVCREGLYWHFRCQCRRSWEVVSRLYVTDGEKTECLGVPVPEGTVFRLDTRIPQKKLGEEKFRFYVRPDRVQPDAAFSPIRPEEPFAYLARIKDAYLARRDGQIGAMIKMPRE